MTNDAIQNITLGKAAQISTGYQLRGAASQLEDGATAYVQLKNAHPDSGIDWSEVIRADIPKMAASRYLQDGDIIFSARGARNYAYLIEGAPFPAVSAPHFFVLRVHDQTQLLPEFLAWQINQAPAQAFFDVRAQATSLRNIIRSDLADLPITIPSTEKQKQIAEFWQAAMAEQAILQRLIENRKQQLTAIAQSLATGRIIAQ